MDIKDAVEQAYKNGYSDGMKNFAERFHSLLAEYEGYDTLHIYEIKDRIDLLEEMEEQ